jgi:hypothetical protein
MLEVFFAKIHPMKNRLTEFSRDHSTHVKCCCWGKIGLEKIFEHIPHASLSSVKMTFNIHLINSMVVVVVVFE